MLAQQQRTAERRGRQARRAVYLRPETLTMPVHIERHRPEQTTLYRLVQQHAATFFAETEVAAGADLPQFARDEFDASLECGRPGLRALGPRGTAAPRLSGTGRSVMIVRRDP